MKYIVLCIALFAAVSAVATAEEVLYSGELGERRSSPLSGSWSIVERDEGQRVLVLGEDFRTRSGPDLKIFFSTLPLSRVTDYNAANKSTSVRIAPLKSSRGAQEYRLPESLDLEKYTTWVVHCERYAHLWDGAELVTPEPDEPTESTEPVENPDSET